MRVWMGEGGQGRWVQPRQDHLYRVGVPPWKGGYSTAWGFNPRRAAGWFPVWVGPPIGRIGPIRRIGPISAGDQGDWGRRPAGEDGPPATPGGSTATPGERTATPGR